jgi:hypothetical protein
MRAVAPFQLPLDSAHWRSSGKECFPGLVAALGLPVPLKFHITTAAYRRFVEANDLDAVIAEAGECATP